ncbi:MAG: DUF3800 domain-containing protein [Coriobacteriales bacterium]
MLEISLFADESGECGTESKHYLLTLVFHEQESSISQPVSIYESDLLAKGLPDIPLHTSPLMNGHDEYAGMDIQERKRLLQSFFTMLQHLPISYHTFSYRKSEFPATASLEARIRRDIVNFIFDNLDYLQRFDKVKVYYDDGQHVVTKALHDAVEYALSASAVMYKDGSPNDYRLAQAADLICTIELTALKYEAREATRTDDRFFGARGSFKKNWLKKIRKKRL